jgi:hypothetical protein
MKRLFLILAVLTLVGCSTAVPVVMKFPDVPQDMLNTCPDLKTVEPTTTKLSEVIGTVVDNYGMYYNCKATNEDWIEWYKTQKQIFNSVK